MHVLQFFQKFSWPSFFGISRSTNKLRFMIQLCCVLPNNALHLSYICSFLFCRQALLWKHLLRGQCSFLADSPFKNCKIDGILYFMILILQLKLLLAWVSFKVLLPISCQSAIDQTRLHKAKWFTKREKLEAFGSSIMPCEREFEVSFLALLI